MGSAEIAAANAVVIFITGANVAKGSFAVHMNNVAAVASLSLRKTINFGEFVERKIFIVVLVNNYVDTVNRIDSLFKGGKIYLRIVIYFNAEVMLDSFDKILGAAAGMRRVKAVIALAGKVYVAVAHKGGYNKTLFLGINR